MELLLYILLAVAIVGVLILLRIRRRYNAAMNVLMARYTFDRLTRDEQKKVKQRAKENVEDAGLNIQGYENDVERFGWYAHAMSTLDIPSRLLENPSWFKIKNPSKAIKKGDVFLGTVATLIKRNYAIEISL